MTIDELIRSIETEIDDARERAEQAKREVAAIVDGAHGRDTLSQQETQRTDALFRDIEHAKASGKRCEARLERAQAAQAEDDEADRLSRQVHATNAPRPTGTREQRMHVTREARTYSPDTDPTGSNFYSDVCRQFLYNDPGAQDRLVRHGREERADRPQYFERVAGDTTTANWSGLTVPQYLVDMVAPATAALKPLIDNANNHELPKAGMSVNISRVTTATSAANQSAELGAVSMTSADDTLLTIPVLTASGGQNVSRQAIERGTNIEQTLTLDLMRRVATSMDSQLINASTNGLLAVGQTTAYTDASPTPQELWPLLFQAESLLEQALLGVAVPDAVVMHSRRWNWFVSTLGTSWPLVGGNNVPGAQSGGIVVSNEYGSGTRGILPNGLRVIVDNNLPTNLGAGTNQDPILVIASQELHVWTDPNAPVLIRAEQPNVASLGVLLVAYSYWGASPGTGLGRYTNNPGIINGTGTIAPAGF